MISSVQSAQSKLCCATVRLCRLDPALGTRTINSRRRIWHRLELGDLLGRTCQQVETVALPLQNRWAHLHPTPAPCPGLPALLDAMQVAVAHVLHVQGSRFHGGLGPGIAVIRDASRPQCRAIQLSWLQLPAHMQLETGPLLRVLVPTARPLLVQATGQTAHAALFWDHRTEASEQLHRSWLGGLHDDGRLLFQQPTEELGARGGEALVDGALWDGERRRFCHACSRFQAGLGMLLPAKDERLGEAGSRAFPVALETARLLG